MKTSLFMNTVNALMLSSLLIFGVAITAYAASSNFISPPAYDQLNNGEVITFQNGGASGYEVRVVSLYDSAKIYCQGYVTTTQMTCNVYASWNEPPGTFLKGTVVHGHGTGPSMSTSYWYSE